MTLQEFIDAFITNDEPFYFTEDAQENGGCMARKTDKNLMYRQYDVVGVKTIGNKQLCIVVK